MSAPSSEAVPAPASEPSPAAATEPAPAAASAPAAAADTSTAEPAGTSEAAPVATSEPVDAGAAPQSSPGEKDAQPESGAGRGGKQGRGGRGRGGQGRGSPGRNAAGRGGGGRGRGDAGSGRSGRGGRGRSSSGRGAAQGGRAGGPQGMARHQRAHRIRVNGILQRHAAAIASGQVVVVRPVAVMGGHQPHPPTHPPPAANASAKAGAAPVAAPASADPLVRAKQTQIVLTQPSGASISFSELKSDVVIALAEKTWGLSAPGGTKFDPRIVTRLYRSELATPRRSSAALRRIQILEVSQYLERYLWPYFDPETASPEHVMSIIIMVNEKIREGVPAWDVFLQPQETAGKSISTAIV